MSNSLAGNTYRIDQEYIALGNGASGYFGMTPNKPVILRVRRSVTSSNNVRFALYENQPYNGGVPSERIFNVDATTDQNVPEQLLTGIAADNVLTDDDIKFFQVSYGAEPVNENTVYTLKAGTPYIIEIKNRSGGNANLYVSIEAEFQR